MVGEWPRDNRERDRGLDLALSLALRGPLMSAVCMLAVASCDGRGEERPLVESFDVSAEIEPLWPESPAALDPVDTDTTVEQSPRLAIYLDLSSPMSGFLPPTGGVADAARAAESELRTVAQWIPDHLGRVYPGVPLEWRGVAERVEDLPQYPAFARGLFTGTASRLKLAIDEILADLRTGRSEGAAIITDLVGTGEITGAVEVARYLVPWLTSAERRSGDFHVGLIGVRGTYWGAFSQTHCPPRDGLLGCWYSERMPGWKPRLQTPGAVPFYVLLFGRGTEALHRVARSVRQDAASQGIESVWELLTAAGSDSLATKVTFQAFRQGGQPGDPQYALWRNDDGDYGCYPAGGSVHLQGTFASGSYFRPMAATLAPGSGGQSSPFALSLDGERLEIQVDCDAVPDPARQDLRLHVAGTMVLQQEYPDWDAWSTPTDDTAEHPGGTLQLKYFIEDTRVAPASYRVDLSVLMARQT